MKEYIGKGRITLEGVTFYITAETFEGALAKIAMGDYDSYDIDCAQTVDHHVALASIEENV